MFGRKRKDGGGVRLGFRARSTMGAGAHKGPDGDGGGDGDDSGEASWDDPDGPFARSMHEAVDELGARVRALEFDANGEDIGFTPKSTMNAGVHEPVEEADEPEGGSGASVDLGFEPRSTMGAGVHD